MTNLVDDHESICDRCGGVGTLIVKVSYYRGHKRGQCPKCKGTGRLDWVERIFGKHENNK
jgi:DnaJ-class molecular chaperone